MPIGACTATVNTQHGSFRINFATYHDSAMTIPDLVKASQQIPIATEFTMARVVREVKPDDAKAVVLRVQPIRDPDEMETVMDIIDLNHSSEKLKYVTLEWEVQRAKTMRGYLPDKVVNDNIRLTLSNCQTCDNQTQLLRVFLNVREAYRAGMCGFAWARTSTSSLPRPRTLGPETFVD